MVIQMLHLQRQCKTVTEDAMQILQKLKSMVQKNSLPSWWTNKLAVASKQYEQTKNYFLFSISIRRS